MQFIMVRRNLIMTEFYQVFKIELDSKMRDFVANKVGKEPKDVNEQDVRKVVKELMK